MPLELSESPDNIKVVALKQGFDNVTLREPGETFYVPKDWTGSWFKPATEVESEPRKKR